MNKYWQMGALLVAFSMGWLFQGWRLNGEIANIRKEQATQIAKDANTALTDLKEATKGINDAAKGAQTEKITLANQIAALRKDIKNAKPLPVDCKPDDVRMRNLSGAVSATNKAVVGSVPSR